MNDNFERYIPLAVSVLALLVGLSNNSKINSLSAKCTKNFNSVADALNGFEEFKGIAFDNFKVLQKDVNKISHFVGFKGRLGVNE